MKFRRQAPTSTAVKAAGETRGKSAGKANSAGIATRSGFSRPASIFAQLFTWFLLALNPFNPPLALLAPLAAATALAADTPGSEYMTAELISEYESAQPGERLPLAIRLEPQPGWRTYWLNGGDSGHGTRVNWTLPQGVSIEPLRWPYPSRFYDHPFVTYGYADTVMVLTEARLPDSAQPGSDLHLQAGLQWLTCRDDTCVPGKAELDLTVAVKSAAPRKDPRWEAAFARSRAALPRRLSGWDIKAQRHGDDIVVSLRDPEGNYPSISAIEVFPFDNETIDAKQAAQVTQESGALRIKLKAAGVAKSSGDGKAVRAAVATAARDGNATPVPRFRAVLVSEQGWDFAAATKAISVDLPIETVAVLPITAATKPAATATAATTATQTETAATATAATKPVAGPRAPTVALPQSPQSPRLPQLPQSPQSTDSGLGLGFAITLAFLGGLLLNLMPCVFPVIGLKILGFASMGGGDPRIARKHGRMFAYGILVSFWTLALLLITLRAAGNEIGWGFQLQSPTFVAMVAMLIFAMALSLTGLFEIGTTLTGLAGRFDTAAAGTGRDETSAARASFVSGVLATVLATPCTAPFMGGAIAYALANPAPSSLGVFTALGLGMASPYVLLSRMPRLLARLPKPGAWMQRFRQAMAFPLFATAAWLAWVFGEQNGNNAVFALLIGFVLLGLAAWLADAGASLRKSGALASVAAALGLVVYAATLTDPATPSAQAMMNAALAPNSVGSVDNSGGSLNPGCTGTPWSDTTDKTTDKTRRGAAGAPAKSSYDASHNASKDASQDASAGPARLVWETYDPQRLQLLRRAGRPVFLDFTAAWCLTCKLNERVAFSSERVARRMAELGVTAMKADWTNQDPLITRALAALGRSGVPLYVLYSGDENSSPTILPQILTAGTLLDALDSIKG